MGVYDRQIATAKRLIEAKGQRCTWREPGAIVGPANKPTGEAAPADHVVSIVFLSNNRQESLAGLLSMFTGTEVPTGGMRGLMPAVNFSPSLLGQVVRAEAWSDDLPALGLLDEKGIDVLDVNGEVILYYLRFAR